LLLEEGMLGGLPLLKVEGDLDRLSALRLQDALLDHIDHGRRHVLLGMGGCSSIDSGGLAVIFGALHAVSSRGWLGLIGVTLPVRRVLNTVGLAQHERVLMFKDEEDVLKSLAPRA
jgi:anti-anti-sigma factor